MPLILIFAAPFVEVWLASLVASEIGWLRTLGALVVDGFVGFAVVRYQGQEAMTRMQRSAAEGRSLDPGALRAALGIVGGLLIAAPGFGSDLLGWALILPGFRSLSARALKGWVERQAQSGRIRVFRAGPVFEDLRDASPQTIDVTPIKSETTHLNGRADRQDTSATD